MPSVAEALTDDDVAASWLQWVVAAGQMGETDLALTLVRHAPAPVPELVRAVTLARAGQWSELCDLLTSASVRPPATDDEVEATHLLLAAAHAGLGDVRARSWLSAWAARCSDPQTRVETLRLLLAVGESLGDHALTDRVVLELADLEPPDAPLAQARWAAAYLADHDRHAPPRTLADRLLPVHSALERTGAATGTGSAGLLETVARLRVRQPAAARLLLRAARQCSRPDPAVAQAMAAAGPALLRHRLLGLSFVMVVLVVTALAIWRQEPGPFGAIWFAATALWFRVITLPGLTRSETRLWRDLGSLRFDEQTEQVRGSRDGRSGWYGLVGVVAAATGIGVSAWLTGTERPSLGGVDTWMRGTGAPFVWIAVTGGLAVGVLLLMRAALRTLARRQTAARHAAEARRRRADAGQCRCWNTLGLRGPLADEVAAEHLVLADPEPFRSTGLSSAAPESRVGRCPRTGLLWALGLRGALGATVALRGDAPTGSATTEDDRTTGVGMYL